MSDGNKMDWYLKLNNYDKTLDYLEKLYEISWQGMPYISILDVHHPELKDNPRYIALLKKMNLPVD